MPGMPDALVGHTGLVGTALKHQLCPYAERFNSKNIADIRGRTYDTVYCAGLPAAKWLANRNGAADGANMRALFGHLKTVQCKLFVLISTVDVYDHTVPHQTEEGVPCVTQEPYGNVRWQFEELVRDRFPRHLILRLPALFGAGLKKNVLYDLLHDNRVEHIHADGQFQWYGLGNLAADIQRWTLAAQPALIVNLVSEPLGTRDIVSACPAAFAKHAGKLRTGSPPVPYRVGSVHGMRSSCAVLGELSQYVRMAAANTRRLSVSNLAWRTADEPDALDILRKYGVRNVELAPTHALGRGWEGITVQDVRALGLKYAAEGFRVTSLQALFYGTTWNCWSQPEEYLAHLDHVVACAAALCSPVRLVLGSPGNRSGPPLDTDTLRMFAELLARVRIADTQVTLCLEPNAPAYGCDFVTTLREANQVVDHVVDLRPCLAAHFGVNLDFGNSSMANDALMDTLVNVRHVQVSEANLQPLDAGPRWHHLLQAHFLHTHLVAAHGVCVSLEQRHREDADALPSLDKSVATFVTFYGTAV